MDSARVRRLLYRLKNQYATTNNAVVFVAFFIAISWAWGSVSVMQRNYKLQREIDSKERQVTLMGLENERLKYEKKVFHISRHI